MTSEDEPRSSREISCQAIISFHAISCKFADRMFARDRETSRLNHEWLAAGMAQQRRSGLSRALFCVRLMGLANQGTAADRFSFLVGAFIADDLDALMAQGNLTANTQVAISGNQATAR